MPIPQGAATWPEEMDPTDMLDFVANFAGEKPLLEEGEEIDTFTVALLPEAVLLGVNILTGMVDGGDRTPAKLSGPGGTLPNSRILIWLDVTEADREDPVFEGSGANVGVVFTIITNSAPSRRRQRTFQLIVRQR